MDDGSDFQGRKRKGSLRKTVLLGVERLRGGDRRSSLSTGSTYQKKSPTRPPPKETSKPPFAFELPNSSTESHGSTVPSSSESASGTTNDSDAAVEASTQSATSPTSTNNSTVSDEDRINIPQTNSISYHSLPISQQPHGLLLPPITSVSPSPSPPSSESSGPASQLLTPSNGAGIRRRRSTLRASSKSSPLTAQAPITTLPPIEEEWDYSDTEWWGWIILIVTWIVFVVGMGSCLGVWSWAWDVGETPYAPPELEDDPTLPIVGYYPALLVLTAVMSWVWVVVAWVGLKYFKHAKMGVVEDG